MTPGQEFNPYKIFVGVFIPLQLVRYRALSPAAKIVWGRLAFYAGESGVAWPKQESLAEDVGLAESYVRRLLDELEREKFIICEKPQGTDRLAHKSSRYRFIWHEIFDSSPDQGTPECHPGALRSATPGRSIEKDSLKKTHKNTIPEDTTYDRITSDTPLPPLLQADVDRLKAAYPKPHRNTDRAIRLFARSAERNRIIRNAGHYSCSADALNGYVMGMDKFVAGGYRDHDTPLGQAPPDHAWKENLDRWEREAAEERARGTDGRGRKRLDACTAAGARGGADGAGRVPA